MTLSYVPLYLKPRLTLYILRKWFFTRIQYKTEKSVFSTYIRVFVSFSVFYRLVTQKFGVFMNTVEIYRTKYTERDKLDLCGYAFMFKNLTGLKRLLSDPPHLLNFRPF